MPAPLADNSISAYLDLHLLREDANVDLLSAKPRFHRVLCCAKSAHSFEEVKLTICDVKCQKPSSLSLSDGFSIKLSAPRHRVYTTMWLV